MTWIKRLAWAAVKPFVRSWVQQRACHISAADRIFLRAEYQLNDAQLDGVESVYSARILAALDAL